jgi:hypothetical protein
VRDSCTQVKNLVSEVIEVSSEDDTLLTPQKLPAPVQRVLGTVPNILAAPISDGDCLGQKFEPEDLRDLSDGDDKDEECTLEQRKLWNPPVLGHVQQPTLSRVSLDGAVPDGPCLPVVGAARCAHHIANACWVLLLGLVGQDSSIASAACAAR